MRQEPPIPNRAGERPRREPLLLSFSGLDGAGKSTQIESLCAALRAAGLAARCLTFWDDVVVGARYREKFVHKVYKSERGIGIPGKPVNRRDKNVRGWHLSVFRHVLYLFDAAHLRRVVARERNAARNTAADGSAGTGDGPGGDGSMTHGGRAVDVILLDRYIYDELANLNLNNPLSRLFVRLIGRLTPRPDVAYLLDAEPAAARARKPEYSVEFMTQCRKSYLKLAGLLGAMTVIPASSLPEARLAVLKTAERSLINSGRRTDLLAGDGHPAAQG